MGRPSIEATLWAWLVSEYKRKGAVPPPIEAARQGVVKEKRTAMRHYASWVEAGRLSRPYAGNQWVIEKWTPE